MKRISAVIPVKANSSRLKNKNILPFADTNLLVHKINTLKQIPGIYEIIVTSDSDDMLEIANNNGVIAIKRPSYYADESRPFSEFLEYICTIINGDHLLWACVTSPLITLNRYIEALKLYDQYVPSKYDSLITLYNFKHYLFNDSGPENFSIGINHLNSQDLESLYLFTNGIVISPKANVLKNRYNYGPNPYRLNVNQYEAVDIDTYEDYISALSYYDYFIKRNQK